MDEFEYSVEISDGDWECFFAECEACNMRPPPLARVDDSGMSDIDDTRAILAKRAQKVDRTVALPENNVPPDVEGSPVERFLSTHAVGGLASILSGSEEDIHQQSVNMFFESLKNVTEPERLPQPCQVATVKNKEVVVEKDESSDGQKSNSSTLPINTPNFSSLSARGGAASGKETMRPVNTISNRNTIKKIECCSKIFPETAAFSVLNNSTNKSAYPEIELAIREDSPTETRVNETPFHDLTHGHVSSKTSQTKNVTDKEMKVPVCTPLKDAEEKHLLTSQLTFNNNCDTNSPSNTEMLTNIKWKEEQTPLFQFDAMSVSKSASQELSPSASIKRKRRKKRRLSFEPPENSYGCERRVLVQPSDSEEEQYTLRGGTSPCLSDKINISYVNESPVSSLYSVSSNLPVRISAGIKAKGLCLTVPSCDNQHTHAPENILRQNRCKATSSAENNAPYTSLSTSHDNVMSAANHSGNMLTNLRTGITSQEDELTRLKKYTWSPVSNIDSVTGEPEQDRTSANSKMKDTCSDCFNELNEVTQTTIGCGNNPNLTCSVEVKSITGSIQPCTESHGPAVRASQNDRLSDAKSVLAAEAGNSIRDNHTPCQSETESQQQLEVNQFSSTLDKTPAINTSQQPFDVTTEFTHLAVSPSIDLKNICASSQTCSSQREINMSSFEDLSPSDITQGSPCCKSLSNENITVLPSSFCSSLSQNESRSQEEKTPQFLEVDATPEPENPYQSILKDSTESKPQLLCEAEYIVAASKAECEPKNAPDSKHSVFAMSSFWNEMEKLTINDILGLRLISEAAPPFHLPTLQESQEADMLVTNESGSLAQLEPEFESKPMQTNEQVSSDSVQTNEYVSPDSVETVSGIVGASSSKRVTWKNEHIPMTVGTDIYPQNMMSHLSDISEQVLPESAQKTVRKISKNISVHNLYALEPEGFTSAWTGQTLQTFAKGELEKSDNCCKEQIPKKVIDMDSSPPSLADSYRISVSNIFQYFFGGKHSNPSQSATDDTPTLYIGGKSVSETYDHFFSEFDTENFFCPLITAKDQAEDEQVPIFSYSCTATRNLQFPDVYDSFFASSSSDDSSESGEEDNSSPPVRVVSRFSRNANSQIYTDMYENFFSDSDLRQNFFWNTALSFRNITFSGSKVHKRTQSNCLCCIPVKQSNRAPGGTLYPSNAMGNQNMMFADPLLYHLEDRISRQEAQEPSRYEDLQAALLNPRLDISLLPLKQSDMCLICIAFASWVLKTANPQVGDAWKAVLLANMSALSAIRYLRKYVKLKATEKRLHHTNPPES